MRPRKLSWPVLSAICAIAVLVLLIMLNLIPLFDRARQANSKPDDAFSWQLKLLTEHADDPFWREVIAEGARLAGGNDCRLDVFSEEYYLRYSMAELIDIAVLQDVDGILIEADGTIDVATAIRRARRQGIHVITLLGDAPESGRDVAILVNHYLLGRQYGEAILALDEARTVTVLLAEKSDGKQEEIIFNSIGETLAGSGIELGARVMRSDSFASEREIHRILTEENPAPDVLLCLNAEDSLRAAQILVDYNVVGKIDVIGYYDAAQILRAVEKGILQATISLDAASVGAAAIESFLSLEKNGRASEYRVIQTRLVDAANVHEVLRETGDPVPDVIREKE